MANFDLWNVLFFCVFFLFVFYQEVYFKNCRASSGKLFDLFGGIFTILGLLTGLVYFIIYAIQVVWWAPFLLFLFAILSILIGVLAERIIGVTGLTILAFPGWPLVAYFMFTSIPT